ncbi:MAG: hypothetical protein Q4D14_02840 [Bacteroidales bacterium]|nr:hypothetical protein [Bacteroidales bacterium]
MYNKFIIRQDGTLVFGNVYLHRDLLPHTDSTCYGGGLWQLDYERHCIILFGRSFDFGTPDFSQLQRIDYSSLPIGRGWPIFYQHLWLGEEILEPVNVV